MISFKAFLYPTAICAFLFSLFSAPIATADTVLGPGDTVSVIVVGTGDFDTRATIDSDGMLQLPIIGRVKAAGLTVDVLGASVAEAFSDKPIQTVTAVGQMVWRRIEPVNVYMSVAEFRPVYVTGDVRTTGAQPFRPGMTVRQALVLAGGLGLPEDTVNAGDITRLLSERTVLDKQLALTRDEITRLQVEVAALGNDSAAPAAAPQTLAPRSLQWLEARAELRAQNAASTALALQQMEDRLLVLGQLEEVSKAALKTYETEYDRVRSLADRGVVTTNAVTEAQRGVLSFSSRALEATSEAYNVRNDIARLNERTKATRTAERIETLDRLLAQQAQAEELRARIAAVDARLPLVAVPGSDAALQTKVAIFRTGPTGPESETRLEAEFKTAIAPGDVIEFLVTPADDN